jgi:hypothetical protein
MLEAMARIASSKPNGALARIAPHSPLVPKCYTTQSTRRFFGPHSKLFSKVQIDSKRGLGSAVLVSWEHATSHHQSVTTESHNFTFGVGANTSDPPCSAAAFVVN